MLSESQTIGENCQKWLPQMQWRNYGGGHGGHVLPPAEVCAPWVPPPIQNFAKIGHHLRLQDTTFPSIDTPPPRNSGAPHSAPKKKKKIGL